VVCDLTVTEVGVDAAAISLRGPGSVQELAAATDRWAEQLEEAQYTAGDGPGVEAVASGGPVVVGDLVTQDGRWPGFGDAAAELGLEAVFAFPLQAGSIRVGSIDLYRHRRGTLAGDALADAAILADLATTAVLTDSRAGSAGWTGKSARGHYEDVHVAAGMLAAQLKISVEDAFLRLRAYAFGHHRPLLDVAGEIIRRRLRRDAFTE
jgi:hypothetical protein